MKAPSGDEVEILAIGSRGGSPGYCVKYRYHGYVYGFHIGNAKDEMDAYSKAKAGVWNSGVHEFPFHPWESAWDVVYGIPSDE